MSDNTINQSVNSTSLVYDTGTSFNGNVNFELNQGTYSDEIEIISPYIASIFTSIQSTLEGFNSLVQSANSYFLENEEIEKISLPDFQEINFQVNMLPNNGITNKTKTATVTASSLKIRASANGKSNQIGSIQNGETVEILESDESWTKISYQDASGTTIEGYVGTKYIEENSD